MCDLKERLVSSEIRESGSGTITTDKLVGLSPEKKARLSNINADVIKKVRDLISSHY